MMDHSKTIPTHEFIDFMTRLQSDAGLQPALSRWYNQPVINSHFLIYTLWFATKQYGRLRQSEFMCLQTAIQTWHDRVSLALGRVHHSISGVDQSVSKDTLTASITTEREMSDQVEQYLLGTALPREESLRRSTTKQLSDACHNVASYYKYMEVGMTLEDQEAVAALLKNMFSTHEPAEIQNQLEAALVATQLATHTIEQLPLEEM